ncbi:acyl-CoA dehydrogenase family protein [Streptomyces iranensis]|uniref:Acyl-CoA dehydrogenase n=1 Tax=Streptomyces iranensis TaxID=576784 RepID=A0A061A517_9ACTN|nr:acyl-CoA dehydrogenase family protein [Streptomyces iranensis]MBP2063497.1 long-chain-acyl-CoA dehydrogenase [Streptomyces iranensis]CDR17930.1 acyl-CoA dehydrogenase [Streptomyces iranensis]
MQRKLYEQDHEDFRATVREYVEREVLPHRERWDADRMVGGSAWLAAGRQGILGLAVPEEYGGGGVADVRYRSVVIEELARVGAAAVNLGFGLQDDIFLPYLLSLATSEQKARWLPGVARGELIGAIAMTEPGAGSDLQGIRTTAVRDGQEWILNGTKTFITNGIAAGLVIVVARTDPSASSHGLSLLMVEHGMPGFERGRKLDKIGLVAQDTAELAFEDVRVPAGNLLGEEGGGFAHLMANLPGERLSIALQALYPARAVLDWTLEYTKERMAFGKPLAAFQNTQFRLADMATELDVVQAYVDNCLRGLNAGELTAVDAAKAKLATTELQQRVVDRCLQLFGGYGYMSEYPVSRAFLDARVQTIYGGTSEIMRTIIGRDVTGMRS